MFERHPKSICETGQWCTQASKRRCDLPDRLHPLSKHNPTCLQHSLFTVVPSTPETLHLHSFIARPFLAQTGTKKLSYGPNSAIVSKIDLFQLSSWSKVSFALQEGPSRGSHKANDAQVTATLTWLCGRSLGWYHCYYKAVSAKKPCGQSASHSCSFQWNLLLVFSLFKPQTSLLIKFLYTLWRQLLHFAADSGGLTLLFYSQTNACPQKLKGSSLETTTEKSVGSDQSFLHDLYI